MNKKQIAYYAIAFILSVITNGCNVSSYSLSGIGAHTILTSVKNDKGWGLKIEQNGKVILSQPNPVQIELFQDSLNIISRAGSYKSIKKSGNSLIAKSTVKLAEGLEFEVADTWRVLDSVLNCKRNVKVKGNSKGGFLTAINFISSTKYNRQHAELFAPGMIYGGTDNLSPMSIGGKENFIDGYGNVFIREDRMPAPLFGVFIKDGLKLTILDPKPDARTSLADAHDVTVKTLIDSAFHFGSLGASIKTDNFAIGYNYPGSEGDITYRGNMYPGGQEKKWRRRYHPVVDGFQQNYSVAFKFSDETSFHEFYTNSWRWAWNTLKPTVVHNNIELVRKSIIDMLSARISTKNGVTGIPIWETAVSNDNSKSDNRTVLGFVGKSLEVANYLLKDAEENNAELGKKHRQQAEGLINTFLKLKLSPPEGEGFNMDNGKVVISQSGEKVQKVYLRVFSDDFKALLKAVKREKELGIEHNNWIFWVKGFGDWLITQQYENGGFPRSWEPGSGKIIDISARSSYNPVPFLLLLSDLTRDEKYKLSALKAGEFCWNSIQQRGIFVGGTIDNPDVIDKEAGSLSLEAYISLYEYTHDKKWLDRAQMAANYIETWIYIWSVPMVVNEDDSKLGWKKGVSTVGLQLISTGHSLVDEYMSFDVDEYAFLFKNTGERHYFDVAKILLHNTKNMVAVPGRLYDLKGAGWQQEHWSLAPLRGNGLHRGWLPWASTSQLNGIEGLKELDVKLYDELCK